MAPEMASSQRFAFDQQGLAMAADTIPLAHTELHNTVSAMMSSCLLEVKESFKFISRHFAKLVKEQHASSAPLKRHCLASKST